MIDPITLELIQTRLTSVVREMRTIVIRTAYSAMIHEGHDFSCAILDPSGELVAASEVDQPTHLCALPWSARTVLAKYRGDVAAGDLFIHNDPYTGGTHLNDVGLYFPVFLDGELFAFAAVMAHWQDIGGMVPGSLSGTANEIFQEGVRIPGIRIACRGTMHEETAALLFANVRQPQARRGDLQAMIGACTVAERRLGQLAVRFGPQVAHAAQGALMDRAEARMRAAIGAVPDGTYAYEAYLDNTGDRPEPLRLRLTLTVRGDAIQADFAGCAPQVSGPTNLGPAHATTAVFTMCKALLDPTGPINAGAMRPLEVITPPGTVVNARPPAACGAIGEVRRALESLVVGTLGRALPQRLVGDLKGASNLTGIGGRIPGTDDDFLFVEFPAGGTGGFSGGDGNNTVRNFAEGDISSIQPVESVELTCPLRVERVALRADSGGAGRWRGGLGLHREVRLLAPAARLSVLSDKNVIPPYGVRGGHGSAPNRFTVVRDGTEIEPSPLPGKITAWPMHAGDLLLMRSAGGGGYGDPLERDPAAVARDVDMGYVTTRAARAVYGVVLRRGRVDAQATAALRAAARTARVTLRAQAAVDDADATRRIAAVAPDTARRLRLREGALVEFPNADGPSLRAWIRIDAAIEPDACALDAAGLSMLGVGPGASLQLRVIEARA